MWLLLYTKFHEQVPSGALHNKLSNKVASGCAAGGSRYPSNRPGILFWLVHVLDVARSWTPNRPSAPLLPSSNA